MFYYIGMKYFLIWFCNFKISYFCFRVLGLEIQVRTHVVRIYMEEIPH